MTKTIVATIVTLRAESSIQYRLRFEQVLSNHISEAYNVKCVPAFQPQRLLCIARRYPQSLLIFAKSNCHCYHFSYYNGITFFWRVNRLQKHWKNIVFWKHSDRGAGKMKLYWWKRLFMDDVKLESVSVLKMQTGSKIHSISDVMRMFWTLSDGNVPAVGSVWLTCRIQILSGQCHA